MSSTFPIISPASTRGRSRRDLLLWALVAGAIVLLAAMVIPLALSGRLMYRYQGFVDDLTTSASYGRRHGSITLEVDGEKREVSSYQAGKLVEVITSFGMGRPSDAEPAGNGIALSFGDGSTLRVWPVEITEKARLRDEGVLVHYTRPDGTVFAYDTDKLSYEEALEIFG